MDHSHDTTATPPTQAEPRIPEPRADAPSASQDGAGEAPAAAGTDGLADGRLPSSAMRSYALLTPEIKQAYMAFYKATYGKSRLDLKTKELIAISAALVSGCKGCLEGHLKKARREGATVEEISEVVAIALGVNAATVVDRSDIANFHLGGLFEKPQ
ncbi:MAG: carboxymuconolactone decarboxylase family protein [Planctomycetes bacterium]|nr:carboxymuconolactone decarboxylase family protein [Planctomycetota bacterium]